MGDFNAVRSLEERKGGRTSWQSGMKSDLFNSFIAHSNLAELKFSGSPFTWCNNQGGQSRIWARLDRALCNYDWLNEISQYQMTHLARYQSDHSPLLVTCQKYSDSRKRLFKFDNNWIHLPKCHDIVASIWRIRGSGNPMHDTSHKIHNLKKDLIRKCRGYSQKLSKEINMIEDQIASIESEEQRSIYGNRQWNILRPLYNRHKALLRQNTGYWAQKSRMQWLQNGDCNSRFFHQMTKNHRHHNRITLIKDEDGNITTDPLQIEEKFIEFYSNLW
ncbi:hypothetical protein J5N97_002899 [Dioscorea zingiberensis]|uniref:Endonuclease/exonuclease/phosphatase domain-containing protein n=1 Tax=Dioscorea zingiberensis TaxID=325984 RepID=A0A9D5HPX3_9LILI|nr:hypothetical protein J5N97_002899 [Dioscorea zingiberensis]